MFNDYACSSMAGKRSINQDSVSLQRIDTIKGTAILAMVCDGLGGFDYGELASGHVVQRLSVWFYETLPQLLLRGYGIRKISRCILKELYCCHNEIKNWSKEKDIRAGTTVSLLFSWNNRYLCLTIGDSIIIKAYKEKYAVIGNINCGNEVDSCIGYGAFKNPAIYFGRNNFKYNFLLCSDGFYRNLSKKDLNSLFYYQNHFLNNHIKRNKTLNLIIENLYERGETDNCSALVLYK